MLYLQFRNTQLGYEKLDDIIGHTELLRPPNIFLVKTQHLDLSYMLSNVGFPKWSNTTIRKQEAHSNDPVLDDILLSDVEVRIPPVALKNNHMKVLCIGQSQLMQLSKRS
ncbi:unnamed protein product [Lactuca virosa]|uniref:Uncharacterized protein n=1 Tax=Lactuca virosa TaxID=75947 RepID=A0AAU9M3Q3_9ASTR|nr:unnamed protein product [Lactuca virosa]